MAQASIVNWIGYWDRASLGPNIARVQTFSDLQTCRRFNPAMRNGVMVNVTDAAMWSALQDYRRAA
jgi:hypothetical protein